MIKSLQDLFTHFKNLSRKPVLFDVILPLVFFEVWSVFLAFAGVVILEAWIINKIIKQDYKSVLRKTAVVNFFTTIVGYLLQGILRFIFLMCMPPSNILWDNPFVAGFFGNVGAGYFSIHPIATIVEVSTSFLITFILSVIIETRRLKRSYAVNEEIQELIPKATLSANIASYLLLLIWVLYYIKIN